MMMMTSMMTNGDDVYDHDNDAKSRRLNSGESSKGKGKGGSGKGGSCSALERVTTMTMVASLES